MASQQTLSIPVNIDVVQQLTTTARVRTNKRTRIASSGSFTQNHCAGPVLVLPDSRLFRALHTTDVADDTRLRHLWGERGKWRPALQDEVAHEHPNRHAFLGGRLGILGPGSDAILQGGESTRSPARLGQAAARHVQRLDLSHRPFSDGPPPPRRAPIT